MNIIKLTNENLTSVIKTAVSVIKNGGVIVVPFDTVYGFLCDANNDKALKKIFDFKKRPLTKTVGVAVANFAALKRLSTINPLFENFVKDNIPGPFTFIFKLKNDSLSSRCQLNGNVGIRIPNSRLILAILKEANIVGAQTSANKSGQNFVSSIEGLNQQFAAAELDKIDLIVDGGKIKNAFPSKILDLTGDQIKKIERG